MRFQSINRPFERRRSWVMGPYRGCILSITWRWDRDENGNRRVSANEYNNRRAKIQASRIRTLTGLR